MSFVFRAQNPDNPGEWFEVGFYPPILEERYGVFINVGTYKEIEEAEDAVHYLNGGGGRRETDYGWAYSISEELKIVVRAIDDLRLSGPVGVEIV